MEKAVKKYIVLFVLVFMYGQNTFTQILPPKTPLIVNVDYSRFKYSADSTYLEIYYLLFPSGVTLEKTHDTLKGAVILQTMVRDSGKDSIVYRSLVSAPVTLVDTMALNLGIIWKTVIMLPHGNYELTVHGYDYRKKDNRDSIQRKFTLEKKNTNAWISDIDLCSRIVQSDQKNNPFYKNSYEVISNPSLLFGGKNAPVVFSYAELYNLNSDSAYSIKVEILDGKGNVVKQRKRIHRYKASNIVDVNSLNINSLPSSKYSYALVLSDTLGRELARSEKPFFIHNPQISSRPSTALSIRSGEFSSLSEDELNDEFRKSQYIASADDRKAYDKLITVQAKREFLAAFWTGIENGKSGNNGMTRYIYLDRIATANQRYHVMGREGWHTDRGRVYVLFGEADEVERFPSSENAKPYEIWHFNQIEGGVQFVFVDRTGFGEYTLVHSTKRGEIQDEGWERNL
jgi:GWxTD domain-containing protein